MAKKKRTQKYFESMRKSVFGGAVAVKSTDLLKHARSPTALKEDASGFAQIGVAGMMSEVAARPLNMLYGGSKKKKKKRR